MSLSGLIANTDLAYSGQRFGRGRRAPPDVPGAGQSKRPIDPIADSDSSGVETFDAAYYQSRLKADLSDLRALDQEREDLAAASGGEGNPVLYDFFGNLSVLLISVRAGDLERARAAADALELEVMVEASVGPRVPGMLGDLRHLLSAAQSGDESGARAAARALALDVQQSLHEPKPYAQAEAVASLETPPVGAAAYDALMAYIDEDTPSAA